MLTSFFFFSNLLTLLLSGNIQTDFFCIRNVQDSFFVFEGTYQFWNTSDNGERVWDQTSGGEENQLFLGGDQCTNSNNQQQVMAQYSATNCWCLDNIGIYGYTCAYFAPINDTNIGPDKVFHGWFDGVHGFSEAINITTGRCGSDVPTITTEDFCSTGTPKSENNDMDGTFSITEQEKNGEYVWYHQEKEFGGLLTYDNYLYIGLNNSQCVWKSQYPSTQSIQSPYAYCWCIGLSNPTVGSSCEIFAPIASKNVLPNEVPIGWYNQTGNKWEEFEFIEGEGCNDVNRLHYSVFITFLCYFVSFVLQ